MGSNSVTTAPVLRVGGCRGLNNLRPAPHLSSFKEDGSCLAFREVCFKYSLVVCSDQRLLVICGTLSIVWSAALHRMGDDLLWDLLGFKTCQSSCKWHITVKPGSGWH